MNSKTFLVLCLLVIVLSSHFFDSSDAFKLKMLKKKKFYKYAKLVLLGAALGGKSKKFVPIPVPLPIPFKEKKVIHHPIPIKVHFVEERPYFIHDSGYGSYHNNMW